MDELTDRLEAARQAAAELARMRELERRAAELADLERQAAERQQRAQAEAALAETVAAARQTLESARPAIAGWNERLAACVQELDALAREMAAIQRPIWQAGREVMRAADALASVGWTPPTPSDPASTFSVFGQAGGIFEAAWRDAGGGDAGLAVRDIPDDVLEHLQLRGMPATYNPAMGTRNFILRIS